MEFGLDFSTLLTALLIFVARVVDVALGTVRTISIVHGRIKTAFFLGFIEVSVWLVVMAAVLHQVMNKPVLGIFYALGFSMGNVVGIFLERKLALGNIVLRIISPHNGRIMAARIRELGFGVTTFEGEGMSGPVLELYTVCQRKNLKEILNTVENVEPNAFYMTEPAASVSKLYRAIPANPTGWRAIFKKK